MHINVQELAERDLYKLLAGSIVPRPIAWVSTIDQDGIPNLAPFSFFNMVSANPPAVSISIGYTNTPDHHKDTLRNITESGEFVVSIVDEDRAQAMNITATNFPPDLDEFAAAGLTATPSVTVRAPRVAESPVSMECKLFTLVPVGTGPGSNTLVIGVVQMLHIRDDIVDQHYHIDITKLKPVARLAGSSYAYVHEIFDMVRPVYDPHTGEAK